MLSSNRKILSYESAQTLADLDILDKMETLDALDDEIAFLEAQLQHLAKERRSLQVSNQIQLQQRRQFERQFASDIFDDSSSEIYRSFGQRQGFQSKLKLGDLVVFTGSTENVDDDGPTPAKRIQRAPGSKRQIGGLSQSVDARRGFSLVRQSQILKKMQVGDSEYDSRKKLFGFEPGNLPYQLTDKVMAPLSEHSG